MPTPPPTPPPSTPTSSVPPDRSVLRHRLAALGLLLAGIALSVAVAAALGEAHREAEDAARVARAEAKARLVERLFEERSRQLHAARRFAIWQQPMRRDAWRGFVEAGEGVGLSWIEYLPGERRAAWEAAAAAERGAPMPLRDDSGAISPPREVHYVLAVTSAAEPLDLIASGVDLVSVPDRAAMLERAWRSGDTAMLGAVPLYDDPAAGPGLIVAAPVYAEGDLTRERPRGAVLLAMRPGDLVTAAGRLLDDDSPMSLVLIDGAHEVHFQVPFGAPPPGPALLEHEARFDGRPLLLRVHAAPAAAATPGPLPGPLARLDLPALAIGLALAVAISAWTTLALRLRRRQRRDREAREAALRALRDDAGAAAGPSAPGHGGDGAWEWDARADRLSLHEDWLRQLRREGLEATTLDMPTWRGRVHPADREAVAARLADYLAGVAPIHESMHRVRTLRGQWRWVLERARIATRDAAGAPALVLGTEVDIDAWKRLQDETALANRYLASLLASSTEVAIIATEPDGMIRLFNAGAERLLGWRAEDVVGLRTPLDFHDPEEVERRAAELSRQLGRTVAGFDVFITQAHQQQPEPRVWRYLRKDGQVRSVRLVVTRVDEADGSLAGFLGIAIDVSRELAGEQALRRGDQLLRNLSAQVPGAIYQYRLWPDGRSSFPFASDGIRDVYEVSPEEAARDAESVVRRIHPDDLADVAASILESSITLLPWRSEYRVRLPQRGERWLHGEARPERLPDGSTLWHGYISDVTTTKQLEARLREEASHDALTGACNRRELQARAGRELDALERSGRALTLLMLDLDDFKAINDALGHDAGDDVLKSVVRALRATARPGDEVFRTGGEEFVLLCPGLGRDGGLALAEALRAAVAASHAPGEPPITASVGVAEARPGDGLSDLLKRADEQVYAAKHAGKDRVAG